ncbi:MAG: hypothetical protein AB7U83_01940 [Vicinamibacterales bacterium]
MTPSRGLRLALGGTVAVVLATASASMQTQPLLPSSPKLAFGGSISPAYDGWWDNPDGTRTFMMGYYSRNWKEPIEVPIGPNNHFEPGEPDRGQPTYFLPNRNFGMFTVTLPKGHTEKLWWVLTVNGVTQRVPLSDTPDYTMTPQHSSEEGPDGEYNEPAILRFAENGPAFQLPLATRANAVARIAMVGEPMTIDFWVEDDARHSSGSNAPMSGAEPMVELVVNKFRGPGKVTVGRGHHDLTVLKGGKPGQPFAARGSTTVTFDEPGEYLIHVTANDLSGPGGGAAGCCWTTGLVKVSVKPVGPPPTGR